MKPTWVFLAFLQLVLVVEAGKRFHDVSQQQRTSSRIDGRRLQGWSPNSNSWDEKSYPMWEDGDSRWNNCWKGGKVVARLTSDSPALVGSNVTFVVMLEFPRCQKEDENGDIVYDRSEKCRNDSSVLAGKFVYNWTQWLDYCDLGYCFNSSSSYFPDGRPFPHHHGRRNFIYIFQTLGQYFQQAGGSSVFLSLNTTEIALGPQLMEVSVYRRGRKQHTPVAKASGIYIVTDEIPFVVNVSQKNDRNATDNKFIKDSPISFTVEIHDPSHYLNASAISYDWNFGDGNGSFVSSSPLTMHTYTLAGNFSLNLTIKAAVPGPCTPVTTPPNPTTTPHIPTTTKPIPTSIFPTNMTNTTSTDLEDLLEAANPETVQPTRPAQTSRPSTPAVECVTYRYGYYKSNITIVEGVLEVNILQMTRVEVSTAQVGSVFDFIVTCQGSIPKDACTIISDSSCMMPLDTVCDQVATTTDECLLTLRRSFSKPGTYCVNISLSDDASLALTSTLLSVQDVSGSARTVVSVLIPLGFLAILVTVTAVLLVKRYKQYKPVESAGAGVPSEGVGVYFSNMKAVFITRNNEKRPLLKSNAGII